MAGLIIIKNAGERQRKYGIVESKTRIDLETTPHEPLTCQRGSLDLLHGRLQPENSVRANERVRGTYSLNLASGITSLRPQSQLPQPILEDLPPKRDQSDADSRSYRKEKPTQPVTCKNRSISYLKIGTARPAL